MAWAAGERAGEKSMGNSGNNRDRLTSSWKSLNLGSMVVDPSTNQTRLQIYITISKLLLSTLNKGLMLEPAALTCHPMGDTIPRLRKLDIKTYLVFGSQVQAIRANQSWGIAG